MEDSINYIARDNPDAKVHADIQLKRDTDSVQIVIVDDGRTYNPIPGLAEATLDKPGALEAVIVMWTRPPESGSPDEKGRGKLENAYLNWRQTDPRFNRTEAWPRELFPEAES